MDSGLFSLFFYCKVILPRHLHFFFSNAFLSKLKCLNFSADNIWYLNMLIFKLTGDGTLLGGMAILLNKTHRCLNLICTFLTIALYFVCFQSSGLIGCELAFRVAYIFQILGGKQESIHINSPFKFGLIGKG